MNSRAFSFLRFLALLGVLAAVFSTAGPVCAEEKEPVSVVLHPAPAPQPILKYQLLPTLYERRSGNAAVYYGRVKAEQTAFFSNRDVLKKIDHANDAALAEVREMDGILCGHDDPIFRNLERAGQCESCDWQYPVEEEGFGTLLPDAQEQRMFARMLMADIRKRIAQGDFDGAIRSLKVGYAMARHSADAPFLVTGHVGLGVAKNMSEGVLELIQQPETPNLYWALTYLPQPFIDYRRVFEGEIACMGYAFPQMENADHAVSGPDYWLRQLEEMGDVYLTHICDSDGERARFKRNMSARLLRGYPLAKRALIEGGMDSKRVEAMPVGQVVILHTAQVYDEVRDEALAYALMPRWQGEPYLSRLESRILEIKQHWEIPLPLAEIFPAMQTGRRNFATLERQFALLRVLEAIRLYGAAHEGRLPQRLEDITKVPIPVDPFTGKLFEYHINGDFALLEGPPLPWRPFRYKIRLASESER